MYAVKIKVNDIKESTTNKKKTKVLNGVRRDVAVCQTSSLRSHNEAMVFSRCGLWHQTSISYKILYIRAYAFYCYSISK